MPDTPIEDLMNGPYANDEPPVRVIMRIGRIVEERVAEALAEHERRYHRGHQRRRSRSHQLTDDVSAEESVARKASG